MFSKHSGSLSCTSCTEHNPLLLRYRPVFLSEKIPISGHLVLKAYSSLIIHSIGIRAHDTAEYPQTATTRKIITGGRAAEAEARGHPARIVRGEGLGGDEESGEEGDNWLSSSAGLSGYATGISEEGSGADDRHWALISRGGAASNGEHELALEGEPNPGHV